MRLWAGLGWVSGGDVCVMYWRGQVLWDICYVTQGHANSLMAAFSERRVSDIVVIIVKASFSFLQWQGMPSIN